MSMIEATATLLLVGMAILMASGLLFRWRETSARLDTAARAEQVLASEMDLVRSGILGSLKPGTTSFAPESLAGSGLSDAVGSRAVVTEERGALTRVTLTLTWADGGQRQRDILMRTVR
jgi:hypothetical protein